LAFSIPQNEKMYEQYDHNVHILPYLALEVVETVYILYILYLRVFFISVSALRGGGGIAECLGET
jgi:hypothetical protein